MEGGIWGQKDGVGKRYREVWIMIKKTAEGGIEEESEGGRIVDNEAERGRDAGRNRRQESQRG